MSEYKGLFLLAGLSEEEKKKIISCLPRACLLYTSDASADENGYAAIPKSMTELASMLGLGRASLYRSLESLEKRGIIIRENSRIKVTEK